MSVVRAPAAVWYRRHNDADAGTACLMDWDEEVVVAAQDDAVTGAERRRSDEGRSRAGARNADIGASMDWAEAGARQLAGAEDGRRGLRRWAALVMGSGHAGQSFRGRLQSQPARSGIRDAPIGWRMSC